MYPCEVHSNMGTLNDLSAGQVCISALDIETLIYRGENSATSTEMCGSNMELLVQKLH